MEKTEAVNKLKKAGYQVQFDSSVVTVLLPAKANTNQEIKKLKNVLREMGYDASFGIKQVKELNSREEKAEENKKTDYLEAESMTETEDISDEIQEDFAEQMAIGKQFSLEDFGIS